MGNFLIGALVFASGSIFGAALNAAAGGSKKTEQHVSFGSKEEPSGPRSI